jgi:putative DNA modification/repair radical SAM protein
VQVAEKLRLEHGFGGYIHLKAIPGASPELVRRAGLCVDRLSVNIELPSNESLQKLAPDKSKTDILQPMGWIGNGITESRAERRKSRRAPRFAPAGQSTQMIVGASPESDLHILKLSSNLYNRFDLKRVYYSAYVPVGDARNLPALRAPPLLREHRLYQADWLMRFYGFGCDEILDAANPNLDETLDPKAAWALRNPHFFPVDVNRAPHAALLRVPGVGVTSAARIATARRFATLRYDDLKKLGVVLKRARFFIRCPGMPDALSGAARAGFAPGPVRLALAASSTAEPSQLLLPGLA